MDRAAIEEHVRKAVESIDGVVSVYLFGSWAEGRQHGDSDVDLGVLLDRKRYPDEAQRFEQRLRMTSSVSFVHGPAADVVILNDAPATLGRAIVTKGVRILCRDLEQDHAYVRDVQLQAPDLELWLDRMRNITLQTLRRS